MKQLFRSSMFLVWFLVSSWLPTDGDGDGDGDGDSGGTVEKQFSQADLDRILKKERGKAAKGTRAELAESLGVSLEDLPGLIQASKDREDKEKSDAQRELEAAQTERAALAAERESLAAERRATQIERALQTAGMDPGSVATFAPTVASGLAADADTDDIVAAVSEFKEGAGQALFNGASSTPTPSYKPSRTREEKPTQQGTNSYDEGKRIAAERFGTAK